MTYPLVQFVSAPEVDADVRFDFNAVGSWADAETWPGHEGFSIGVPSLEGDPDAVGVEYGFRELSFSLFIKGDKASALAAQSALAKEILRRTNWLRFQLTEHSEPVWFKTYRSAPGEIDFQYVYTETAVDHWGIAVTLTADPFAYGERETLPTVTIRNDPAAATNPMSYLLPEIKGDAPAPLSLYVKPTATAVARIVASTIGGSPTGAPYVWQSSDLSGVMDAGPETTSSSFSGGSYMPITFATSATHDLRASTANTITPPRGRYKLFARVARSDTSSAFTIQAKTDSAAGQIVTVSGTADAATWATIVDLGDFDLPAGGAYDAPHYADETTYDAPTFFIHAGRTSGTGQLRVDYLMVMPLRLRDGDAGTIMLDEMEDLGFYDVLLDGEQESTALSIVSGILTDKVPPALRGSYPQVTPGTGNLLHLLSHVATTPVVPTPLGASNADVITTTTSVEMSYQPRYLYLAGN